MATQSESREDENIDLELEGAEFVEDDEIQKHLKEKNIDIACTSCKIEERELVKDSDGESSSGESDSGAVAGSKVTHVDSGVRVSAVMLTPIQKAMEVHTVEKEGKKESGDKKKQKPEDKEHDEIGG